jgi:hypothetical protein
MQQSKDTKEIDYKASVIDLYEDAHMTSITDSEDDSDVTYYIWSDVVLVPLGISTKSEHEAWKDAFFTLKNQHKL